MPSPRLSPKVARLLAMQMFAVVVALLAVLAFVLWNTRPNGPAPGYTGGIDAIHVAITWMAFVAILGALIYIHVNFARQLLGESKGVRRGVETW
jgi:hypothetical protein